MRLVGIRENEVTVELDWSDVKYLTFLIRHAISYDVGSSSYEPTMLVSYAETVRAFLEAAGMASWAYTIEEEKFTLERFHQVVPITPEEHRAEQERFAAARRERGRTAPGSAGAEAPPAA